MNSPISHAPKVTEHRRPELQKPELEVPAANQAPPPEPSSRFNNRTRQAPQLKQVAGTVGRYLLRGAVVVWAAFTLAYALLAALPGDAITARFEDPQLGLSAEQIAEIRQSYGFDQPLVVQYFKSLSGFLSGDFGYSVTTGSKVTTLIGAALPGSLQLAAIAIVLAVLVAGAITLVAVLKPNTIAASVARFIPSLAVSTPTFLVGILLIQVISFHFHLVPVIGASGIQQLILPAITLAIPISAPIAGVMIREADKVATEPFITVARARGATLGRIFTRHIVGNIVVPTLTIVGVVFGEIIGGAVITEAVFGRAGLGTLTINAVANRDTPVLLAVVIIAVTGFVIINTLVELAYPLADARLRRKVTHNR